MARKKYRPEQIIARLREAHVLLNLLSTVSVAAVPNLQLAAFWMRVAVGSCCAGTPQRTIFKLGTALCTLLSLSRPAPYRTARRHTAQTDASVSSVHRWLRRAVPTSRRRRRTRTTTYAAARPSNSTEGHRGRVCS